MMITGEARSTLAGMEKKRKALQGELVQIDKQIQQTEEAQTRIEERIKVLVQRRRQAA